MNRWRWVWGLGPGPGTSLAIQKAPLLYPDSMNGLR